MPVPTGTTTGNVLVTVGGVASNPYGFEVGTAAPKITSISPTSGAVATSVTINGTSFGSTQGSNTVNFNGVSGVPTSWTATQIKVPVPTGATTGNVVVTASGTVSNGVSFTVPGTGPSVTSLSPSSGPVGTSVTIAGTNFDATQGASTVSFNGITGTATGWSPTSIVATVPSGATTGNVVVTVAGTTSSGSNFIVAPSITSLSPTSGAVGTTATITGTSFGSSQGTSTVTFNGTAATPTSWGASSITVLVPSAATTGNVVVTVGGVASNGVNFTVVPTPTITSLNPATGGVGATVTITGTNFGATQGSSTITFNGMVGTPTSWSATSIVVPVPAGATTGNLMVTVNGVPSAGSNFTVAALTSLSITPAKPSISMGSTQQFTATGTYSDNSTQNLTAAATWTSSGPSIATVNSSGFASALAPGQTVIQAAVGSISGSTQLAVQGFVSTGSLATGRSQSQAVLLNNGTVLVVGGTGSTGYSTYPLASAELYNPATGTFAVTGSLNTARTQFTATLLTDGTVLIAGGYDSNWQALTSAEIYNPTTGVFTTTGNMGTAHVNHAATLLRNGSVLIAGGLDDDNGATYGSASAELYSPSTGSFVSTGNLSVGRGYHTATRLNDGTVLIAGGALDPNGDITNQCELYDPSAGSFSQIAVMNATRAGHTATLLNSGMVLIAGGVADSSGRALASADLYNPSTKVFAATGNMNFSRDIHASTLLNNGTVLVEGGFGSLNSAEVYEPVSGSFSLTGSLNAGRSVQTATLLPNGNVLVAGGWGSGGALTSAELYEPATLVPANLVSISVSPLNPTVMVGGAQPFVATGTFSDSSTQTLASVTWNSSNAGIATVTDDASNNGFAYAGGPGSATITVCAGSVCGSTGMTVTLPPPPPPSITSLSPTSGAVGSVVTISGANFGATQGASTISFNGIAAGPTVWSATNIVVPVPNGATSGPISITVNGSPASTNFQVLGPYLASIAPSFAGIGSTVTVIGTGFGATQGTGSIIVGGKQPFVVSWSDTQIVAAIIPGTTSGQAQVSQGGFASNSLNFAVATPSLARVSPASGTAGTQVTFSGSGFGTLQGGGNVLLGTNYGSIVSWSDTQIIATVTPGSASGTAQVLQGGAATTSIPFTIGAPTIASVSPTTGSTGTHVTITGSGFGASQGSGKVLLGTNFGTVVNWSDTQIVATVAPGSTSGSAQIVEGAVRSNSLNFTVIIPTITSVTSTSGAAGTQVTIFGSGFGAVQGNGNAWIGSSYASVVSWSDTQVVATVASVSAAGNAQILQNGVWSNSVLFTSNTPFIASVTPPSGITGTPITITGSGFGSSTGTLQLGSMPGVVSSWTDTQIVATVASASVTGIVQVQQNSLTSNALRFVVPTAGSGNNLIIVPSLLNLVVGQTHAMQALTPDGTAVAGLNWTSSDPTVVSLSTDDPPVLTVLAPGHVTVTAGDSSSDITVSSGTTLPINTVIWSDPGDDSGVARIIPAVPSPLGVADTFAVQNSGKVQAITSDGSVAWTADVGTAYTSLNADFQGGLAATNGSTITKYDGITGHQTSQYTYANPGNSPVYFGTDGTIFTIDGDSVVGVDPATGTAKFSVRMQHGGDSYSYTCESNSAGSGDEPPGVQASTLAGDGYFYVFYQYMSSYHADAPLCGGSSGGQSTVQRVLRVGPTGDHTEFPIGSHSSGGMTYYFPKVDASNNGGFISIDSESGVAVHITSISTNADQGIFASWVSDATNAYCSSYTFFYAPFGYMDVCTGSVQAIPSQSGVMTVSGSGVSQTPTGGSYGPVLQAMDGTFYGGTDQASLSAFDISGNVKWNAPGYTPVMLTGDGSVIAQSGTGQYVTLDQNGVATGQIANFPVLSWKGTYKLGSDDAVAVPTFTPMTSLGAVGSGNFTGNGTPLVHHSFGIFWCGIGTLLQGYVAVNPNPCPQGQNGVKWGYYPVEDDTRLSPAGAPNPNYCPTPSCGFGALQDFSPDHPDWVAVAQNAAFSAFQAAFAKLDIQVVLATQTPNCPLYIRCAATTTPDQDFTVYILGDYPFKGAGQLFSDRSSVVHYFALMEGAQQAFGTPELPSSGGGVWIKYLPSYPPADEVKFLNMLGAVGTAIGNAAAHEIGHHLESLVNIESNNKVGLRGFPFMDCGLANPGGNGSTRPVPIHCEADDNFVYNFYNADGTPQYPGLYSGGAMFFYGVRGAGTIGSPYQEPIHWGPSNKCWLANYAAPQSCKRIGDF